MVISDLENRFTYHPPKEDQVKRYEAIRTLMLDVALFLDANILDSREKSLAITHLEEATMWANAAIARNE